jgi:hypothetical protein
MPIWLRKFTFRKLKKFYDKKNAATQEENIKKSISSMKQAQADNLVPKKQPTYTTKASKK